MMQDCHELSATRSRTALSLALTAVVFTALSLGTPPATAQSVADPEVSAARVVNGPFPWPNGCGAESSQYANGFPYEPGTATDSRLVVDPREPRRAVVAFIRDVGFGVSATSTKDGGVSWREEQIPGATPCTRADDLATGDQDLAIGPDGSVVMAAVLGAQVLSPDGAYPPGNTTTDFSSRVAVWRSNGPGRTWSPPSLVWDRVGPQHQVQIATDPNDSRRVVVAWSASGTFPKESPLEPNAVYVAVSEDGGRTFEPPRVVFRWGSPDIGVYGGALFILKDLSFGPDGTVVFAMYTNGRLHVARSTDGGHTFSTPSAVAPDGYFPPDPDIELTSGRNGLTTGGNHPLAWSGDGTLYAVVTAEPPALLPTGEVSLYRSADRGQTWERASTVASVTKGAFGAAVAAGPENTLAVQWIDMRDDVPGDDRTDAQARIAVSGDGGRTWTTRSMGPRSDLRRSPRFFIADSNFLGNYQALAAQPEGFLAVFSATPPAPRVGADVLAVRVRISDGP